MPMTQMPTGLILDRPALGGTPYWRWGRNVRSRMGQMETLGLFAPLRTAAGAQITLPGADRYRTIKAVPAPSVGQIVAASVNRVMALEFDPASTPGTGTCWASFNITPTALPSLADTVSDPGIGRVEIPPAWWFVEQEDIVVGGRANATADPVYVWDRATGTPMTAIPGSPTGAVGGGIIGRILVLLGCTSFTDPDPQRFMTVRWSDRYDFADWTPSDINLSGELQLEGGSRIMGGGVVGKGVVVWTDTRMAVLTETGDIDSVFARRYIDGGRGLMANRSWVEADGRVWWYDETRTLNVWDGGAPRQVPNPLRLGTIERLPDRAIGRAYMSCNPEFNEVVLWYDNTGGDDPNEALVYNYADEAWSTWALGRGACTHRVGAIRALGVDAANKVFQHDLDSSLVAPWLPEPMPTPIGRDPLQDAVEYSWSLQTNLIVTDNPEQEATAIARYLLDHLPSPAPGGVGDTFTVEITGYGDPSVTGVTHQDTQEIEMGQAFADFRVEGKAFQIRVFGTGKTVWRFGQTSMQRGKRSMR